MILQELVNYYNRQAASGDSDVAPPGFEYKEISFAIVIDENGHFVDIEDLRSDEKKPRGRKFLVPQGEQRSGPNPKANLLWDNVSYVFGIGEQKADSETKKKEAFKRRVIDIAKTFPEDKEFDAAKRFVEALPIDLLKRHRCWLDLADSKGYISFRLRGALRLISENQKLGHLKGSSPIIKVNCMVTGNADQLMKTHQVIKGIQGDAGLGARLVSFKQPSFRFFGKMQGANAPVGQFAAFAYTTALNNLLNRDSRNKLVLGDTSVVFWTDGAQGLEDVFSKLFGEQGQDSSVTQTDLLKEFYGAPVKGIRPGFIDTTHFYILGLALSDARVAIRFWYPKTSGEVCQAILQYFSDIKIIAPWWERGFPSLIQLLLSAALQHKKENVLPSMTDAVFKAIITGTPFPISILQVILRRIRSAGKADSSRIAALLKIYDAASERELYARIDSCRAALLKAYFCRFDRYYNTGETAMSVALNESNRNIGYVLGRLFAILEKIQAEALGDVNATIRDRYYNAASATPVICFPTLMRLKNHHINKISNKGRIVNLEKITGEVIEHFNDFPSHLSLSDQGRFAVGYYHQRQAFYERHDVTKLEESENNENN